MEEDLTSFHSLNNYRDKQLNNSYVLNRQLKGFIYETYINKRILSSNIKYNSFTYNPLSFNEWKSYIGYKNDATLTYNELRFNLEYKFLKTNRIFPSYIKRDYIPRLNGKSGFKFIITNNVDYIPYNCKTLLKQHNIEILNHCNLIPFIDITIWLYTHSKDTYLNKSNLNYSTINSKYNLNCKENEINLKSNAETTSELEKTDDLDEEMLNQLLETDAFRKLVEFVKEIRNEDDYIKYSRKGYPRVDYSYCQNHCWKFEDCVLKRKYLRMNTLKNCLRDEIKKIFNDWYQDVVYLTILKCINDVMVYCSKKIWNCSYRLRNIIEPYNQKKRVQRRKEKMKPKMKEDNYSLDRWFK